MYHLDFKATTTVCTCCVSCLPLHPHGCPVGRPARGVRLGRSGLQAAVAVAAEAAEPEAAEADEQDEGGVGERRGWRVEERKRKRIALVDWDCMDIWKKGENS